MRKSYDFSKAKQGAVLSTAPGKTRITIRIDDDVLEWFRKRVHELGGGSYQAMMNHALRHVMESEDEPLEETLRRVLEDVLPLSGKPKRPKPRQSKAVRKKAATKKAARKKAKRGS